MAQVEIPEAVRQLALHPMLMLPVPPGFEQIEVDGVMLALTPFPLAQCIEPLGVEPAGIPRAVESTRALARERGKTVLAWWIAPEHDHLAPQLEALGIVNEDTPGFEAVENAMALVTPPKHSGGESVETKRVESFEEYHAAAHVSMEAFAMPAAMRAEIETELPRRYEEVQHPDHPGRNFVALIDGRVVGGASAVLADAGVNLFGGSVHPDARGRGVYGALVRARWELAVERGTPALTIQAGRMSRPIAEHLGFTLVAPARLFVDNL